MKKSIFLFSIIGMLTSCSSDDDNLSGDASLVGKWKLIEVLADPGDGSGTFSAVNSNKTITFHPDGKITSNGNLCDMGIKLDTPSSGTYSVDDSLFSSFDCNNAAYEYRFEHTGETLIIFYPCFEACQTKYQKV